MNKSPANAVSAVWRFTLGPVYDRLIRRYFDTALARLQKLLREVHTLSTRVDELDRHVHALLEAGWEQKALARRIAMIEDRLELDGDHPPLVAADGNVDPDARAQSTS